MKKVVLGLAVSLDGYIEGPNGEYDWCFTDQDYGMKDFFKRIDAVFIGRKTYELMLRMKEQDNFPKMKQYVFSNTLKKVGKDIVLVGGNIQPQVNQIKNESGKDIWLFGGAELTSSMMNLGLVDEVSLAVHPIILGSGKPLFMNIKNRVQLSLISTQSYSTGLVSLSFRVMQ